MYCNLFRSPFAITFIFKKWFNKHISPLPELKRQWGPSLRKKRREFLGSHQNICQTILQVAIIYGALGSRVQLSFHPTQCSHFNIGVVLVFKNIYNNYTCFLLKATVCASFIRFCLFVRVIQYFLFPYPFEQGSWVAVMIILYAGCILGDFCGPCIYFCFQSNVLYC